MNSCMLKKQCYGPDVARSAVFSPGSVRSQRQCVEQRSFLLAQSRGCFKHRKFHAWLHFISETFHYSSVVSAMSNDQPAVQNRLGGLHEWAPIGTLGVALLGASFILLVVPMNDNFKRLENSISQQGQNLETRLTNFETLRNQRITSIENKLDILDNKFDVLGKSVTDFARQSAYLEGKLFIVEKGKSK